MQCNIQKEEDALTKLLSIIVPVYYNEASLPLLVSELTKIEHQLISRNIRMELVFVDDGSGDNSLHELLHIRETKDRVKIIKLARNFGSFHAIKAGLPFVTGDCFMFLAADLQDPPGLIVQMIEHWLQGEKFIICTRSDRQDPVGTKIFASLYYQIVHFFVIKDYPRGGFDLALMDKILLPYLQNSGKNINISLFVYWLGFKPVIIPYIRQERKHGKSRWTFSKKFNLFFDSILGFSIVPIRLISLIGIFVSLLSFFYSTIVIISVIFGKIDVRGFPTTVVLLSFLLGLIIVMLGIIGEYLWRIFDEVNKRPEVVIDEIYEERP